jgi:BlaI family penicillinase repressor
MAALPRISETEWEIMRVVWGRNPVTAAEIIEELSKADASWHPVTAKTLINRLVKKGALGFDQEGRAYLYRPLVSEGECISAVSSSFLERVFGGSLSGLVAHFVEQRKLSPKQLRELRKVIDDK